MTIALTGDAGGKGDELKDVQALASRLAHQAGAIAHWKNALEELSGVRWQVPAGLRIDRLVLFTHGDSDRDLEPVPANARSVLAVSPFLDDWGVSHLLKTLPSATSVSSMKPRLISTAECLSEMAKSQRAALSRYDLRSLPESNQDEQEDEEAEAAIESSDAGSDGPPATVRRAPASRARNEVRWGGSSTSLTPDIQPCCEWDKRQRDYRAMGYRMGPNAGGDSGLPSAAHLEKAWRSPDRTVQPDLLTWAGAQPEHRKVFGMLRLAGLSEPPSE